MVAGNQTNVEYWFRLLYDCLHGSCYGGLEGVAAFLAHLWLWIIFIGYAVSVLALIVIVYCMVRLFELRKREHEYYTTLIVPKGEEGSTNTRWEHIQTLLEGTTPSEWKEAIIEADILLEDALTSNGYEGASISEKLKAVDEDHFHSLQKAWEAHRIRNQIAHQGSAFELSETLARRTIGHYEAVFRELKVI